MKTLTEFAAPTLRNAAKTKQELVTAGKTPEELPAAMGEALKLEGDKLGFLLSALEMVESRLDDLKRVVVFTIAEGEKAPSGSQAKGEQQYSAEYYPPIAGKGAVLRGDRGPRGERGGKGGRGDKKGRGGKGRGGRGRRDGERGERSAAGAPGEGAPSGGPRGERGERRPPRGPRGPRPAPQGTPGVTTGKIIPKNAVQTPATVPAQPAESMPAAPATEPSKDAT